MILICRLRKDHQINLRYYQSIYTKAWVSLHTVLKTANLKSRQQRLLSEMPNIMFANNSAIWYDGDYLMHVT